MTAAAELRDLTCPACGSACDSERALLAHFRSEHRSPRHSRSINRVQCRICSRNFDSEYSCLQHQIQGHRDRSWRRRLSDAEALSIRESMPPGPPDPAAVAAWAQRLGVSRGYVWAVGCGLAHLHQDALPADSVLNAVLDRRYRQLSRKRSVRRRTVQVKKHTLLEDGTTRLTCAYCGVGITLAAATKDHKLPINQGGGNEIDNLHLVCRPCNRLKSDCTDAEFRFMIDLARVYGERAEGLVLRIARRLALLEE